MDAKTPELIGRYQSFDPTVVSPTGQQTLNIQLTDDTVRFAQFDATLTTKDVLIHQEESVQQLKPVVDLEAWADEDETEEQAILQQMNENSDIARHNDIIGAMSQSAERPIEVPEPQEQNTGAAIVQSTEGLSYSSSEAGKQEIPKSITVNVAIDGYGREANVAIVKRAPIIIGYADGGTDYHGLGATTDDSPRYHMYPLMPGLHGVIEAKRIPLVSLVSPGQKLTLAGKSYGDYTFFRFHASVDDTTHPGQLFAFHQDGTVTTVATYLLDQSFGNSTKHLKRPTLHVEQIRLRPDVASQLLSKGYQFASADLFGVKVFDTHAQRAPFAYAFEHTSAKPDIDMRPRGLKDYFRPAIDAANNEQIDKFSGLISALYLTIQDRFPRLFLNVNPLTGKPFSEYEKRLVIDFTLQLLAGDKVPIRGVSIATEPYFLRNWTTISFCDGVNAGQLTDRKMFNPMTYPYKPDTKVYDFRTRVKSILEVPEEETPGSRTTEDNQELKPS